MNRAPASPADLFEELFARVQLERLFPDGKHFADAWPKLAPAFILGEYRKAPPRSPDALRAFVEAHFELPAPDACLQPPDPFPPALQRISELWAALTRAPTQPRPYSSELPLSGAHVVPGGRFRELYYWDSYSTLLGLTLDGHGETAAAMVEAFADLIHRYGHVPNGSRSYYLSRSQPPVFHLMLAAVSAEPARAFAEKLDVLRREHAYWMAGEQDLEPGEAFGHVVALSDGARLNRYWDAFDTPRDESYADDVALAGSSGRPERELWRDLRAGAESGWDFSSRWLAEPSSLASIETTAIVPIDLNCLLYGLERTIVVGCAHAGDIAGQREFEARATARKHAVRRHLWDEARGIFLDFHWRRGERLDRPSAAMLMALFMGLAEPEQARGTAAFVRAELLWPGGLVATATRSGQQWDAPNGWAPVQWIGVQGLRAYGETELARTLAEGWLRTVGRVYAETGRLLEKYDVERLSPGGGGEYSLQDGFGWTNGVTRALCDLYPDLAPCPLDCLHSET